MTEHVDINEQKAATAFGQQAQVFDELYRHNTIIEYKRERVRNHVQKFLHPGSFILELNAGTGEDAIYFARNGHRVHATDVAPPMQEVMRRKIKQAGVQDKITCEIRSYTDLEQLLKKGPYDLIFSNFAGLNCTAHLNKVLYSFESLLKPGGIVTLVILPRFCLWEFMMLFKGKLRTATRRIIATKGVQSHVEGHYFKCWYYNPSYIIGHLGKSFEVIGIEGLCTLVPPSYIEHFAEKHPAFFRFLKRKEDHLKEKWPWKYIGDYYIISLQKRN